MGASRRADQGAPTRRPTRPLTRFQSLLKAQDGVTVHTNGTIVEAGMRGQESLYVRWDARFKAFVWEGGAEHGEPFALDPVRAVEQVVRRLEAPPKPWPAPKLGWWNVR